MARESKSETGFVEHGAMELPGVTVASYNLELRDEEGFVGDRASGRAFRALLDEVRAKIAEVDDDPLGETPSKDLKKKKLDKILAEGDPLAAGIVQGAIEEFAHKLASVIRRFLRLKAWRDVECIIIGGGLRDSRIGELIVGRAAVILKSERLKIDLQSLQHHPDEAGLIGAVQLAPTWLFHGFDAILAADVGGTNIRCGIVRLNAEAAADLSQADVWRMELWRHADDKPKREEAIDRMAGMLKDLALKAGKAGLKVAPLIGIGCPGVIDKDGSIERGDQNLPGNWASSRFNLPRAIREKLPRIGDHDTTVIVHNDAVVQGLSEVAAMRKYPRWGVLTIGTGLGNASFTTKED